jgi:hypothetical protein
MTKRQATTILTLLVVLYVAALVLLAPRFDRLLDFPSQLDWLVPVTLGAGVASPAFLAIWAVHGRQRAAVRVPLTFWLLAVFYLAALYGEVRCFGRGNAEFALVSAVGWLVAYAVLVLPLRLLRAVRGWSLEQTATGSTQSADDKHERQFTIRTLLGWTAAAAALCAGLRWPAPYHAFDLDEFSAELLGSLIGGGFLGLILALAGLPVLSVAWVVLADGRRTILRVVLITITVAGIPAGIAAFRSLLDEPDAEFIVLAVGIEAGVLCAGLLAVLLVRACGYRLVRPSKSAQEQDPEGSSNAPARPQKFALVCASLAAASVALACYAPQRLELWRQADEMQAWAEKGWDASFGEDGRITGLVALSGQDLSGSEFDLAALSGLESLGFSQSMLTDVQLAQYPIQNPALARLASLDLADTAIGDLGLAHLIRFPALTHLNLSHTTITDAGIAHLAALKHLTQLQLAVTDISDAVVESLSRLGQLQSLDLQLTAVSEEGVRRLQRALPKATIRYGASDALLNEALTTTIRGGRSVGMAVAQLQHKRLHARGRFGVSTSQADTPVVRLTDAGLASLSGQTELEELDLRESAVTDAGLTSLVKLTSLKRLDLRGAPVTEGGCRTLAKTLTNCEILR